MVLLMLLDWMAGTIAVGMQWLKDVSQVAGDLAPYLLALLLSRRGRGTRGDTDRHSDPVG